MDDSIAGTLQAGIEKEISRRFDHDDGAMAEYIVVMLQNGKDAAALTDELKDLISNYDASFTTWIFEQIERLKAGQTINTEGRADVQDEAMDTDAQTAHTSEDDPGMGYPSARLYSGIKKTLQDTETERQQQRNRHRPDTEGVRSTPYGTVAVGNGAMRIPTGPRTEESSSRQSASGPIRSKRGRGGQIKGMARNQLPVGGDFPEMPQMPGFPMPPVNMFAGMPLMDRMGGLVGDVMRTPTRRCTKWPTCFKGKACTFGHPTSMCQNPKCRKTDGTCPSIHADEDVDLMSGIAAQSRTEEEQEAKAFSREQHRQAQSFRPQNGFQRPITASSEASTTTPICKFGEACTNRACQFAHPSPASKNGSSIVLNSEFCSDGMECKNENCSYSHPSPSNKYTPGVKLNPNAAEVNCRFNPCLNPTCRFQHAPGQKSQATFGTARNKVWTPDAAVKPAGTATTSTAERAFASGDVEEQFNAHSNVHDNDTEMEK